MRRQLTAISALTVLAATPAVAQAPASADLWRIAGTSLAVPAPLVSGPSGLMWNPAATTGRAVGLEVVQTGSVLGLTGLMLAGQTTLGSRTVLGVIVGRMQVRDLVRTSTSPSSQVGSIPVHEQFVGGKLGVRWDWVELATVVRWHDERFDAIAERGFTIDIGAHFQPTSITRLAIATHFFPIDFSTQSTTDYYIAGELEPLALGPLRDSPWRLFTRYGISVRPAFGPDHMISAGVLVDEQLAVDLSMTRESGYASAGWRLGVSFALRIGRYTIAAARGGGVNDVEGTYRVGLHVGFP